MLASVIAFTAILAIWANRQILNTDNWTRTSSNLLENPVIRDQLAVFLVDQLYANVDVAGEIREALPERLQPLAGPAAGGLRDFAERAANEVLSRPRAQALWADANRTAQEQFLQLIEGGGPVVSTGGGDVVLDLTALLQQMQERVGIGGRIAERLPPSAAQIEVLHSDRLEAVQSLLKIIRGLPIVLVSLSLLLFFAALAIAPGWRRQALRAYGIGFVLAGAAALITQEQAGTMLTETLVNTAAVEPAVAQAWTISTTLLVEAAWATILYGVFMVLAAFLAGPSRPMVALRRGVAPFVQHPAIAYAVFAVFIGLLLWWAPTPATRDPLLALLLIALLAAATEALRRQIGRENPDADMGAAIERIRGRAAGGAAWARQATTRDNTSTPTTIEQLEQLGRLKATGVLDEQEFAEQKRAILAASPEPENGAPPPTVLNPT